MWGNDGQKSVLVLMEGRVSRTFKRMKRDLCPVQVANYGKCVILKEAEIEKDSCVGV